MIQQYRHGSASQRAGTSALIQRLLGLINRTQEYRHSVLLGVWVLVLTLEHNIVHYLLKYDMSLSESMLVRCDDAFLHDSFPFQPHCMHTVGYNAMQWSGSFSPTTEALSIWPPLLPLSDSRWPVICCHNVPRMFDAALIAIFGSISVEKTGISQRLCSFAQQVHELLTDHHPSFVGESPRCKCSHMALNEDLEQSSSVLTVQTTCPLTNCRFDWPSKTCTDAQENDIG
jgi:hypothetical protein